MTDMPYLKLDLLSDEYHLYRLENAYYIRRLTLLKDDDGSMPSIENKGKKDIVLRFSEIESLKIEPKLTETKHSMLYGKLTFRMKNGKKHQFSVADEMTEEALFEYFSAMSARLVRDSEKEASRKAQKQKDAEFAEWIGQNRNPRIFTFLKRYFAVTSVISIGLFFLCLLLDREIQILYPIFPILFSIHVILIFLFPSCFTLRTEEKKYKALYGFETNSAILMLLFSALYPIFFLVKQMANIENVLITSLVITVILFALLLLRYHRECRNRLSADLCITVLFLFLSVLTAFTMTGYLTSRNNLTSSAPAVITETDINHSRKGGTTYSFTVRFEDGKEREYHVDSDFFDQKSVGDTVYVEIYEGILGTRFAELKDPDQGV